jgi:hypothetical protein
MAYPLIGFEVGALHGAAERAPRVFSQALSIKIKKKKKKKKERSLLFCPV